MKKIIITLVSSIFLLIGNANAVGFNIGGSLTGGVFSVDGALKKMRCYKNASSEGKMLRAYMLSVQYSLS